MPEVLPQLDLRICAAEHRYASSSSLDRECERIGRTWLSPAELEELATRHNPHRRQDWLRSRFLLKQLISDVSSQRCALEEIEVLKQDASRRLRVTVRGCPRSWSLSISHSARGVLVALARQNSIVVGVDLTDCEPLSSGFVRTWFTPAEVARLQSHSRAFAASTMWATKEAVFKACNCGEGFDPRQIEVLADIIRYRGEPIDCLVQSRFVDGQVAVVVTACNTQSSSIVS